MFDKKPEFYGESVYKGKKNIEQCDITFKLYNTGHNYHCQLIKGHEGGHIGKIDDVLVDFMKLMDKWDINVFHNKERCD